MVEEFTLNVLISLTLFLLSALLCSRRVWCDNTFIPTRPNEIINHINPDLPESLELVQPLVESVCWPLLLCLPCLCALFCCLRGPGRCPPCALPDIFLTHVSRMRTRSKNSRREYNSRNHFPYRVWLLASVYGFVVSSEAFCSDCDSEYSGWCWCRPAIYCKWLTNDGAQRLLSLIFTQSIY